MKSASKKAPAKKAPAKKTKEAPAKKAPAKKAPVDEQESNKVYVAPEAEFPKGFYEGMEVTFLGYKENVDSPLLEVGDKVKLCAYDKASGTFDVVRADGTEETLLVNEFKTPKKVKETAEVAEKATKIAPIVEATPLTIPILACVTKTLKKNGGDIIAAIADAEATKNSIAFVEGGILHYAWVNGIHTKETVVEKGEEQPRYAANRAGFDEWVEDKFSFGTRKASYFMAIYEYFASRGFDETSLAQIDWSKLREITRLSLPDKAATEEWLEKAKEQTVLQLKEEIQLEVAGVHGDETKVKAAKNQLMRVLPRASVHADQFTVYEEALKRATEEIVSDSGGNIKPEDVSAGSALMVILQHYLNS